MLHQICAGKIKHEEETKFRCRECLKLFSALKFIEKHLSTKHPEVLGNTIDEVRSLSALAPPSPTQGPIVPSMRY